MKKFTLTALSLCVGLMAFGQSFFQPTNYRGAFAPAPSVQWTDTWTNFDPQNTVPTKLHTRSVAVIDCTYVDYEWMHPLIIQYHARTGSRRAEWILKNWSEVRRSRRWRKIVPLAVARRAEDFIAAGSNAG